MGKRPRSFVIRRPPFTLHSGGGSFRLLPVNFLIQLPHGVPDRGLALGRLFQTGKAARRAFGPALDGFMQGFLLMTLCSFLKEIHIPAV